MDEATGAVKSPRTPSPSPPHSWGGGPCVASAKQGGGVLPPQPASPKRRRAPRVRHAQPRSPGPERVKDRPSGLPRQRRAASLRRTGAGGPISDGEGRAAAGVWSVHGALDMRCATDTPSFRRHGLRGPSIDRLEWVSYPFEMEPVQFSDALKLTELSESQLREWCGKRGLFQPTVPARGPGRVALYSWQDLIALRVFREIFQVFGGRACSWAPGIAELRLCLTGQFFPNLWGRGAIFPDQRSAYLGTLSLLPVKGAALFVPLDPHRDVISSQATPDELQGQLPLVTPVRNSR